MIWDLVIDPFVAFGFMRRALVGCLAIALGGTPVGVFLVLRRMSLTGDAIAHAILPGAAVGYLVAGLSVGAMTVGGLVAGLTVGLLAGFVTRATVLREDASLAGFYLTSLALGVLLVSMRGGSVDLMHVLLGNVLALDDQAMVLLAGIATVTLVALAVAYRPLVVDSVDPEYLRTVSRTGARVHYLLLTLAVINLVAGFHALGTLMAVGIMIVPATAARFWHRDLAGILVMAVAIAVAASLTGLLLSFHFGLPSGPAIILCAGGAFVLSLAVGPHGSLLARRVHRRHLRA